IAPTSTRRRFPSAAKAGRHVGVLILPQRHGGTEGFLILPQSHGGTKFFFVSLCLNSFSLTRHSQYFNRDLVIAIFYFLRYTQYRVFFGDFDLWWWFVGGDWVLLGE